MPDERKVYATQPALSSAEWYAENQCATYSASAGEPPHHGVCEIVKEGSIVKIRNRKGHEVWISDSVNKKALAAIALRSFSNPDGSPIVSHAMIDRLALAGASADDLEVLRSLLPPQEYEASI